MRHEADSQSEKRAQSMLALPTIALSSFLLLLYARKPPQCRKSRDFFLIFLARPLRRTEHSRFAPDVILLLLCYFCTIIMDNFYTFKNVTRFLVIRVCKYFEYEETKNSECFCYFCIFGFLRRSFRYLALPACKSLRSKATPQGSRNRFFFA